MQLDRIAFTDSFEPVPVDDRQLSVSKREGSFLLDIVGSKLEHERAVRPEGHARAFVIRRNRKLREGCRGSGFRRVAEQFRIDRVIPGELVARRRNIVQLDRIAFTDSFEPVSVDDRQLSVSICIGSFLMDTVGGKVECVRAVRFERHCCSAVI